MTMPGDQPSPKAAVLLFRNFSTRCWYSSVVPPDSDGALVGSGLVVAAAVAALVVADAADVVEGGLVESEDPQPREANTAIADAARSWLSRNPRDFGTRTSYAR